MYNVNYSCNYITCTVRCEKWNKNFFQSINQSINHSSFSRQHYTGGAKTFTAGSEAGHHLPDAQLKGTVSKN